MRFHGTRSPKIFPKLQSVMALSAEAWRRLQLIGVSEHGRAAPSWRRHHINMKGDITIAMRNRHRGAGRCSIWPKWPIMSGDKSLVERFHARKSASSPTDDMSVADNDLRRVVAASARLYLACATKWCRQSHENHL